MTTSNQPTQPVTERQPLPIVHMENFCVSKKGNHICFFVAGGIAIWPADRFWARVAKLKGLPQNRKYEPQHATEDDIRQDRETA